MPGNYANPVEKRVMQGRMRACHETLNKQLKNWGILSQVFCHHISMHGNVLQACVVLRAAFWGGIRGLVVIYNDTLQFHQSLS
jgi:hypothetical protein